MKLIGKSSVYKLIKSRRMGLVDNFYVVLNCSHDWPLVSLLSWHRPQSLCEILLS